MASPTFVALGWDRIACFIEVNIRAAHRGDFGAALSRNDQHTDEGAVGAFAATILAARLPNRANFIIGRR